MKKSHYITITAANIHLIAYRIKQFIENSGIIAMQCQYPTNKLLLQVFGKEYHIQDMKFDRITQSDISYLANDDYQLEIERNMGKDPFIRINYQYFNSVFLLKIGDKIRILPNRVYLLQPHITQKPNEAYPIDVWYVSQNIEKAKRQAYENKVYSDAYWADVEAEWERDFSMEIEEN